MSTSRLIFAASAIAAVFFGLIFHPAFADSFCDSFQPENQHADTELALQCFSDWQKKRKLREVELSKLDSWLNFYYVDALISGEGQDAEIVGILINEIERRKPPVGQHSSVFFATLMMTGRLFDATQENAFKSLGKGIEDFEFVRKAGRRGTHDSEYWQFNDDWSKLTQEYVDLEKGSHIVVYSSPGCGICLDMSTELMKNETLGNLFRLHSIWVNIPDSNFGKEFYSSWGDREEYFPVRVLLDRKNWPKEPIGATPYLFFVKDGKVMSQMLGWSSKNRLELPQHLRGIGLPG